MHPGRIVNHCRNAGGLHLGLLGVAFFLALELDGVLRPAGMVSVTDDRRLDDVLQPCSVLCSGCVDVLEFVFPECLELDEQDGCLKGVEAGVYSDPDIVVLEGSFPVEAVGIGQGCPIVVVGEDGAAVSVASERFCREE